MLELRLVQIRRKSTRRIGSAVNHSPGAQTDSDEDDELGDSRDVTPKDEGRWNTCITFNACVVCIASGHGIRNISNCISHSI